MLFVAPVNTDNRRIGSQHVLNVIDFHVMCTAGVNEQWRRGKSGWIPEQNRVADPDLPGCGCCVYTVGVVV